MGVLSFFIIIFQKMVLRSLRKRLLGCGKFISRRGRKRIYNYKFLKCSKKKRGKGHIVKGESTLKFKQTEKKNIKAILVTGWSQSQSFSMSRFGNRLCLDTDCLHPPQHEIMNSPFHSFLAYPNMKVSR